MQSMHWEQGSRRLKTGNKSERCGACVGTEANSRGLRHVSRHGRGNRTTHAPGFEGLTLAEHTVMILNRWEPLVHTHTHQRRVPTRSWPRLTNLRGSEEDVGSERCCLQAALLPARKSCGFCQSCRALDRSLAWPGRKGLGTFWAH